MADIIPFGRRIKPQALTTETRQVSFELGDFYGQIGQLTREMFGLDLDSVHRIQTHLASLRRSPSPTSIATAMSLLGDLSTEELHEIASRSTSEQWTAKPGYFYALVNIIRSRL